MLKTDCKLCGHPSHFRRRCGFLIGLFTTCGCEKKKVSIGPGATGPGRRDDVASGCDGQRRAA
jgi:hypothetical protein